MSDIENKKKEVRAAFYASCILGSLPVVAHFLVAAAVWLEVFPLQNAVSFGNQNWLGHLIFVALAVGSGTLMNLRSVGVRWSPRLIVNFFHLLAVTVILWVMFGLMAVVGVPQSWPAWLFTLLFVVAGTIFAYNVDMSIALLSIGGQGDGH